MQAQTQFADKQMEKKKSFETVEGKALEQWIKDLKDKDPYIRENAIHMLKVFGSAAREASPQLVKALSDHDVSIRVNAAITIGFVGFNDDDLKTGIAALKNLLVGDPQAIVRFQAAQALCRLQHLATPAAPALASKLHDEASWEIRRACATALGFAGRDAAGGPDRVILKSLEDTLWDHCSEVRLEGLKSLITLGIPGGFNDRMTEERLVTQMIGNEKQARVAIWARVLLLRINVAAPVEDKSNKRTALGGSGADKADKVEKNLVALAKYLKSPDYLTRISASQAFAVIGLDGKSRVADLIDLLESEKELPILFHTIVALGEMGPYAEKALPALMKLKGQNLNSQQLREEIDKTISAVKKLALK